jgi:hypothetical protein
LRELVWRVSKLYFGSRKVGEIVPDERYSGMWRVVRSDGSLSDMVNRTRAKDACEVIFEGSARKERGRHSPSEAPREDLASLGDKRPRLIRSLRIGLTSGGSASRRIGTVPAV